MVAQPLQRMLTFRLLLTRWADPHWSLLTRIRITDKLVGLIRALCGKVFVSCIRAWEISPANHSSRSVSINVITSSIHHNTFPTQLLINSLFRFCTYRQADVAQMLLTTIHASQSKNSITGMRAIN